LPVTANIAGTWRPGARGETWTFRALGGNLYEAVGSGSINAAGVATVIGNRFRLGAVLNLIVERQRLTQAEIATALGINQPKVSALLHYILGGFSVERLMHFLVALGQDVKIVVKSKPRSRSARIAVKAA
jgi:predicted XRE-type DNA-binding protein